MDTIDGNPGTLQGGTFFTAAKVGKGFTFDSDDDRVVVPHNPNLNMAAPGFTVEFWMKGIKNQPQTLYAVVEKSHGFGDFTGWAMQGDSVLGRIAFVVGNGSSFPAVDSGVDVLDGVFHHVAGVWNGSSILLYVDGTLRGSAALTSPAGNTRQLNLGYAWGGGTAQRFFRGVVDELAVYARALSGTEIQSIYNAGASGKCTPCGNGILNPDEGCDDGNTVAGDCCSPTCQPEGSGSPCADDGVACTVDVCNSVGRCVHPGNGTCDCVPRPAGIVSWWRAEGNATDLTDGNNGTVSGPLAYASAVSGQGFDTRNGGAVVVGHNNNLNVNAPGFTAEFWMQGNHSQPEALFDVLDKSHDGTDGAGWTFQGDRTSGKLSFLVGGIAGNNFATVTAGVDVLDGAFHHVAGVWDGTQIRLYIDGELYGSSALPTPKNDTRVLHIGIWTTGRQFKGLTDEVAIYGRSLTQQEIRNVFAAGAAAKCTSPCGNGVVESGEQCDDGNKANGDCCSSTCQFELAGTICRSAAGPCDLAEICSGVSATCPPDTKATGVCRAAVGACDVPETCDGIGNGCPADTLIAAGTVCRAAAGSCDVAEACTGAAPDCPADSTLPPGTVCRPAVGACDLAEACDGAAACPPDQKATSVCRAATGPCDVPETCDGLGDACPADGFAAPGTLCRTAAGACDLAEACTGSGPACPADVKSTAICRAAAGICDVAESCDGTSDDCPSDAFEAAGTVCRATAGACDLAESCTGSGPACPADVKSTAICRAAAGTCDVAESCDGTSDDCPADVFESASTVCRVAAGACDLAESCTGTSAACPTDGHRAAGTICRVSAGACDPSELCSGLSAACPSDARSTSVCRPAVGPCDGTESCNGVDVACPPDVPAPNGTPCDDGDQCTGPDTCIVGTCTGLPNPTLCADDTDADGVLDDADACPSTPGLADRQGCPIGDANLVELHLVDQQKSGACPSSAGSCKRPVEGAIVRVFDRNDAAFQSAYGTKNPSGTVYDQVFERDIGRVGACTTDATGRCTAGEEIVGDYLVIVRWSDPSATRVAYTGKPKSPTDFVDTNGDHVRDLASKDFQIVKLIRRDGTVEISGGSKVVVTGSFLEIVHPDFAVWEDAANGYVYPFVFTSDSAWQVDVCASVPTGYDVVGAYDDDGNFHSSIDCIQAFVANETRAVAFEIIETGSPEPTLFTRLRVKGGHLGRQTRLLIDVPGVRRYRGERLLDSTVPACWERANYSG